VTQGAPRPEFSRTVRVDQIGREPKRRHIEASAAECARLAERLGLAELKRLVADLELRRLGGGRIELAGELEAELVQLCVVTLEPLPARIRESIALEFLELPAGAEEPSGASVIALDQAEPPEPIREGTIDLGEAVVQQLAVAIEPYPRAPGAVAQWPGKESEDEAESAGRRPFAGLDRTRKEGRKP
jgi:uncharacterized metal-binding protein YceD (DUF177 family)